MTPIPIDLQEAIEKGECILFLGPDLSESAGGYRGLPTSWQLADALAEAIRYRGQYQPLPRMAQIYEHRLGRQALAEFLRSRLHDPGQRPLPIHQLIARLPFRLVIHAGWDRLLEDALEAQGVRFRTVVDAADLGYVDPQAVTIFKPYGSVDRPVEGLVITEEQQTRLLDTAGLLVGGLRYQLSTRSLLLIGHALDYDRVFTQIYYGIRREQQEHRPPAFVVQSVHHPDDRGFWESLGITSIVEEPARFLYTVAERLAAGAGETLDLPGLEALSQATASTAADLQAHVALMRQAMDSLGVAELVEQTDVPLLSREQVRNLEAMRAAYDRLAEGLEETADTASVWLRQGNIEYVRQNYERARQYYQQVLDGGEKPAEAYFNLHYLYLAQHLELRAAEQREAARLKLDQAWQAYQKATSLNPALSLLPRRYVPDALLGQGGVGIVYRARDATTGQRVAVKMLKRAYAFNEKVVARFEREAAVLQRIQSPHIVQALEVGQHGDRRFIVMEYLGEQTLERHLEGTGPLPLDQAVDITGQVASALHLAHQQGLIHRDVKPSNIFLVGKQVKVIDFGLAADLTAGEPSQIGQATGTLRYMSPEQQMGQPIDASTDQFSLATVLYEILTGIHPGSGTYQPASQVVDGVGPSLDIVIDKARAQHPGERYRTVQAFAQELAAVASVQPAYPHASPWRRLPARTQGIIRSATQDRWYLVLAVSLLAGYLLPLAVVMPEIRILSRLLGLGLWVILISATLVRLFVTGLARSRGYAVLAAHWPLFGALLGLSITAIIWFVETFQASDLLGDALDFASYAGFLMIFGVAAVILSLLSILCMATAMRVTEWMGRSSRTGVLGGYGLVALLLAGMGRLLQWLFTGG